MFISLVVTTPFLGEIFQHEELTKKIYTHNTGLIADLRKRVEAEVKDKYKDQIDALQVILKNNHDLLRKELAGTGESGKPGKGPAAIQLNQEIADNENKISAVTKERDEEILRLNDFITQNSSSSDGFSKIASRYRVDFLTDSPADREKAKKMYIAKSGAKILNLPAEKVISSALVSLLFLSLIHI